MAKARYHNEDKNYLEYYCPGCQHLVGIPVTNQESHERAWFFNGDMQKPTIKPSIKKTHDEYCCHAIITDGMIFFAGDSTHDLKNSTVELPDL